MQRVAACCSVLQCVAELKECVLDMCFSLSSCPIAFARCSVLQRVAVSCCCVVK